MLGPADAIRPQRRRRGHLLEGERKRLTRVWRDASTRPPSRRADSGIANRSTRTQAAAKRTLNGLGD